MCCDTAVPSRLCATQRKGSHAAWTLWPALPQFSPSPPAPARRAWRAGRPSCSATRSATQTSSSSTQALARSADCAYLPRGSNGSGSPHLCLLKRGGRAQAGQRELPLQPVDLRAACSGWLDQHVAQAAHTLKEGGGGGGGPAAQGCLQRTGGLLPPVQLQPCWRWTPGVDSPCSGGGRKWRASFATRSMVVSARVSEAAKTYARCGDTERSAIWAPGPRAGKHSQPMRARSRGQSCPLAAPRHLHIAHNQLQAPPGRTNAQALDSRYPELPPEPHNGLPRLHHLEAVQQVCTAPCLRAAGGLPGEPPSARVSTTLQPPGAAPRACLIKPAFRTAQGPRARRLWCPPLAVARCGLSATSF